ncbi:MAG: 16S rRNA (guanine(966)-N(2))-methyltransferase RsmD [Clostridiales bacterium]|nr:16S rRNA (guanine(966)-N(2))-methyltransferase RsmD [Clostridiales bacterium]
MRVITGAARGRRLLTLEGEDVRPTTDRVKEAVFSIIQFQIEGRRFLDLFAGSGQMGIEALSRGAALAVFVDTRKEAVETVKKNLHSTGLEKNARVLHMDALSFLAQKNDPFDLAFLDPPYQTGILQQLLPQVAGLMNPGGILLCEHSSAESMPDQAGDFVKAKQYRYGKIMVTTYLHGDVMNQ